MTTLLCLILFLCHAKLMSCPLESYLFVYSSCSSLTVTLIMNQLLAISLIHFLGLALFLYCPCISYLTPRLRHKSCLLQFVQMCLDV